MKFKNLFLFAAIALLASCGKYEFDASLVNQEVTNQNAKNQLGVEIDPNQNFTFIVNIGAAVKNADDELYRNCIKRYDNIGIDLLIQRKKNYLKNT